MHLCASWRESYSVHIDLASSSDPMSSAFSASARFFPHFLLSALYS